MKLADMTWPEVEALPRDIVVLIPTGSLEQHGPHLPLFTDSLLATAVAEAVEAAEPEITLLTPTLWLGASGHHLAFPGSLSNSFDAYIGALVSVAESLIPHGFRKFRVVNGHGGNTDPNGVAMRTLKERHPHVFFGHLGYFSPLHGRLDDILQGPAKDIFHACEAETSLMLHVRPDLVRMDRAIDDGLVAQPPVPSAVQHFEEITDRGVLGYATKASAETGKVLFDMAVEALASEVRTIAGGYLLTQPQPEPMPPLV